METIQSLGLRTFKTDFKGNIIESSKTGIPEAISIPVAAYMESKPYLSQHRVQIVPYNGHELLELVLGKINEVLPSEDRAWGNIIVYKSHLDLHGFTDRAKELNGTKVPVLTPDVTVDNVAFGKYITKLNLLGDSRHSLTLAMKWSPNEMEVAIGTDVSVCDNFNIFTKQNIIRTNMKFNYESMMQYIEDQLHKAEEIFQTDLATINRLSNAPLNDRSVRYLLGDMSLRYATGTPVVSITDHNEITRNIAADMKEGKSVSSMWDFTNHGTSALRLNKSGSEDPLGDINKFNTYVMDMEQLNKRRN
jgi:hypothetical protein